jgi:hypothetical protein
MSTRKANSYIPVTIVDAAVEPYVWSPIAGVKDIYATYKAPIRRGPKHTNTRGLNPGSRYPVIPTGVPTPVARRPQIAIPRANRLLILR